MSLKISNNFPILMILFMGIGCTFSMMPGEYWRECNILMEVRDEAGKREYTEICANLTLTKANLQVLFTNWAQKYNFSVSFLILLRISFISFDNRQD